MHPFGSRPPGVALGVVAALAVATTSAGGTTLLSQNIAQLTVGADLVVEGRVTGIEARWHAEHLNVYTYVTLEVDEVHKGVAGGSIVLQELGGEANGRRVVTESVPAFEVGERVVVFAYLTPHDTWRTLGFAMGKFNVEVDPDTGLEIATRPEWAENAFNVGLDGTYDVTVEPVTGKRFYARFIQEINAFEDRLHVPGAVGGMR